MNQTHIPDAIAERITNLLDKAESTEFEAEQEAFLAKAQELMARHSIDEAMLARARGAAETMTHLEFTIQPPYASAKSTLLHSVAHANHCKVVTSSRPEGRVLCVMFGHDTDLANTQHLYLFLSHQAVRFMLEAPLPPGDTARRFRHSFLMSYAWRIGQRLNEAARVATTEAQAHQAAGPAGRSVSLVMAAREALAERAMREAFPRLRKASVSVSSSGGLQSGRAAADRSSLNQTGLRGGRRALPSG